MELCEFLQCPIPVDVPFPHAYRSEWKLASITREDLATLAPNKETITLIDHDGLRDYLSASRRILPFIQRDGRYVGLPENDKQAIQSWNASVRFSERISWRSPHPYSGFSSVFPTSQATCDLTIPRCSKIPGCWSSVCQIER